MDPLHNNSSLDGGGSGIISTESRSNSNSNYNSGTPIATNIHKSSSINQNDRKLSISQDNMSLGRSFVFSNFRMNNQHIFGSSVGNNSNNSNNQFNNRELTSSPTIHSGKSIHETTVELADVGIDESGGSAGSNDDQNYYSGVGYPIIEGQQQPQVTPSGWTEDALVDSYNNSQNNSVSVEDETFKPTTFTGITPSSAEEEDYRASHSKLSDLLESNKNKNDISAMNNDTNIPSSSFVGSTSSISFPTGSPTSPGQMYNNISTKQKNPHKETDPILSSSGTSPHESYNSIPTTTNETSSNFNPALYDVESQFNYLPVKYENKVNFTSIISSVRSKSKMELFDECVTKPVSYLPAVFLGVLLNILDGLSYGMIMFPIGETVFSGMGPHGLSMFYLSCVISQLVYSLGGSAFKSGIGSEMIEVTPFFHSMAISIMNSIGEENKQEIITTTIFTFAISSIVTGIVFFILGYFKLGKLVGFFPRHILVGCIGGVGYFLVITGIEVSSRLEGGLYYNIPTFQYLFAPMTLAQWVLPLILTVILIIIQHYQKNAIIVPMYFIVIFVIFHTVVFLIPNWDLSMARDLGWCFSSPETNEPWFSFYKFYNFKLANWWIILEQLPTMLALTFFGILHVPINVPALAVTLEMDQFDVDRELIAHGISNSVSGLLGSIQNYLVYTNTVLFIRAGADSRLSGVMLAIATSIVMFIGPVLIGFIPVCVVGSLIYLLGYELLKEAIWDTRGRLRKFEYITIIIIVITMGVWDFVYGILVGVLLACLSFVVEAARKPVISGIYTGDFARSIVIRHPKQQDFLKQVGKQIYIMKLQGSLFFGSIGGLEEKVRERFDNLNFQKNPIKYLIFDMSNVLSIDFSAAEGFRRIRNLVIEKNCFFLITGLSEDNDLNDDGFIIKSLKDSGLWEIEEHSRRIQLFNNLNSGLEWCENKFLEKYKDLSKRKLRERGSSIINSVGNNSMAMTQTNFNRSPNQNAGISGTGSHVMPVNRKISSIMDDQLPISSPRDLHVLKVARRVDETYRRKNKNSIVEQQQQQSSRRLSSANSHQILPQQQPAPIPLIITIMQGLSDKKDNFWYKLPKYLQRIEYTGNYQEIIYDNTNNRASLFFIETGLVKSLITLDDVSNDELIDDAVDHNNKIDINVLPLTIFGDIVEYKKTRQVKYFTNDDKDLTIIWKLSNENLLLLQKEQPEIYNELLVISITLIQKRFELLSNNLVLGNYLKQ